MRQRTLAMTIKFERYSKRTLRSVEHVFAVIKLKFGYVRVRYRGIEKNANQVFTLRALSNE
jgi:IS5 family transposase